MDILAQLSSRTGDASEKSNRQVSEDCIKNPELLNEIVGGFEADDKKVRTDCIEVCTMIAETHPDMIIPYGRKVLPLLSSKETKTRWEAVHTLSFIAEKVPDIINDISADLSRMIKTDKSTIVRDYAIDTIANYAKSGKKSSENAYTILLEALTVWKEKHARQTLRGFGIIIDFCPERKREIGKIAMSYLGAKKGVIAAEAKKIMKRIGG